VVVTAVVALVVVVTNENPVLVLVVVQVIKIAARSLPAPLCTHPAFSPRVVKRDMTWSDPRATGQFVTRES
jgi:hypothetical protein